MKFKCSICAQEHEDLPDLTFDAPKPYDDLNEEDKANATKTNDLCVIGVDYFVRGIIPLEIVDGNRTWAIGAWVSLKKENFDRYVQLFQKTDVEGNGPWFGWLSNSIDGYPETWALKTRLHLRPHPERPLIELEPTEHPLAVQQHRGIHMREVRALVERVLHSIN